VQRTAHLRQHLHLVAQLASLVIAKLHRLAQSCHLLHHRYLLFLKRSALVVNLRVEVGALAAPAVLELGESKRELVLELSVARLGVAKG
jgi:hypothetical protein